MTAVRGLVCVIAVAGCGRLQFDPLSDAQSSVTCWNAWLSGAPNVATPRLVSQLSTDTYEADPFLAVDDRTLYFAREVGGIDIFRAQRMGRGAPFDTAVPVPGLNSAAQESRASFTDDGLLAVISTARMPSVGMFDLWQLERATTSDPFGSPSSALFTNLNTTVAEYDPHLTGDGLRLYYASGNLQVIRMASRTSRTAAFGPPTPVPGLPASSNADQTLSPDERVIVYSTRVAGSLDIYFATRASTADPFAGNTPLSILTTAGEDGDAALSHDGCELFFASDRTGMRDIYVTDITP
jgi:hypothetical protein